MKKRKLSLDRETLTHGFAYESNGVDGGTGDTYNCDPPPILRTTLTNAKHCYEITIAVCTGFCGTDFCPTVIC